jgi:hypothetical protein
MLEHAFKAETVGLVTRDEFVQKRDTIKERLEEEAKQQRMAREQQELQVRHGGDGAGEGWLWGPIGGPSKVFGASSWQLLRLCSACNQPRACG